MQPEVTPIVTKSGLTGEFDANYASHVLRDSIKNTVFFGLFALVVAWIGTQVRWLGWALLIALALFMVLSVLHYLTVAVAGVAVLGHKAFRALKGERGQFRGEGWATAALLTRTVEEGVCVYVLWIVWKSYVR